MVYLDYNASTPLDPDVLEAMRPFITGIFGNPSSVHAAGREARAGIDDARERLAGVLGARPHELIFTSGGTESCNLAILGLARTRSSRGRHIVTVATEHHAVLRAIEALCRHENFEATILPVDKEGRVSPDHVARALRADTTLVTIMHANNETGVIQPIEEIGAVCRARDVLFHTDTIQSFGKLPVNPQKISVDALSLAAHKFYGPKGVGVLWLRAGVELAPTAHGGAHENSRRPGTENTAAIVGMAVAAELAESRRETETARLEPLREKLWGVLQDIAPQALRNATGGLANTLNVSFPGCDGEALLMALDLEGVCASTGSACMVGSLQPSHVLLAMGRDPRMAAIRFSLGAGTSEEDILLCGEALRRALSRQKRNRQEGKLHENKAVAV